MNGLNLLRLLAGREPEPAAPHYECPTCFTRSDDLTSQAEADLLLETHRAYFCWPVPAQRSAVQAGADFHHLSEER